MFSKRQRSKTDNVACIFVHAGAGYHSEQNEANHLKACNDAARSAMAMLKAGGSAIDAVEIAIKVLEDREITNAGYGSNLTMDGIVECDAVVVDHNGRSGGAGAVSQIKNPVSLARLLLDMSAGELSLRRVPPNFLVGQGATDFAWTHGIPLVPHDILISPAARARWTRWKADLRAAEQKARTTRATQTGLSPSPSPERQPDYSSPSPHTRRSHGVSLEQSLFNDAQPISPAPSDINPSIISATTTRPTSGTSNSSPLLEDTIAHDNLEAASAHPFMNSTQTVLEVAAAAIDGPGRSPVTVKGHTPWESSQYDDLRSSKWSSSLPDRSLSSSRSGSYVSETDDNLDAPYMATHHVRMSASPASPERGRSARARSCSDQAEQHDDRITDTVGAIAIDFQGKIACGASSGGIGMKHRGRVGPAALVGIGASVVPAQPSDLQKTIVATVTSGTGEHMATTQAASVCSQRVLHSQRSRPDGTIEDVTEDEAIRAFIERDFMSHPSVTHSRSAGAIGVLSVKKSKDGAWLYFAHNTDSFALASMSSNDAAPVSSMSRNRGNAGIAGGGRAVKFMKRTKTQ